MVGRWSPVARQPPEWTRCERGLGTEERKKTLHEPQPGGTRAGGRLTITTAVLLTGVVVSGRSDVLAALFGRGLGT